MRTWLVHLNDRDLIALAFTIVRLLNRMMRLYYRCDRIARAPREDREDVRRGVR